MKHKKVKIREDKASDVMKRDPHKFMLKPAQKAKRRYRVSIRSLILLTALAVIFVLLSAITVSATVTRPWVRVDVETSASCECAKIGDANNAGGNEIVAGGTSVIYMYVWDGDTWDRTTIGTLTGTVNDIVIADVDNTGGNKIAAALSTNTIYMYRFESGWDRSTVSTAVDDDDPSAEVLDMSVGNADNQGGNKIVASTDDGDVAMFEWNTGTSAWDRTEIVDFGNNKVVYNVDVADCDNDGNNEVVVIHERKYMDPYYYSGGSWASEGEISRETSDTYLNIYVGNADNTAGNEVLSCTNSGYIYMYKGGGSSWSKSTVASTGSAINDINADDVYNDGYNSVVSGNSAQDVIIYTYDSGWSSSTVDDAAGGSVLEVTSGDADNDYKNEIVITAGSNIFLYEIITWESYRELGHSTVWGTVADPYSSTYHVVYMYGDGFTASPESYHVGYYDDYGNKQASEAATLAGTALSSQYDCTSHPAAQYGTWHAVVFKDDLGSPPETYAACSGAAGYIVEDDFEVQESAIPEFPTVIAAIAVCMLCAVAYVVMRRKAGRGDR